MKRLRNSDSFPADIPQPQADKMEFGYVEPGHGLKDKRGSGFLMIPMLTILCLNSRVRRRRNLLFGATASHLKARTKEGQSAQDLSLLLLNWAHRNMMLTLPRWQK